MLTKNVLRIILLLSAVFWGLIEAYIFPTVEREGGVPTRYLAVILVLGTIAALMYWVGISLVKINFGIVLAGWEMIALIAFMIGSTFVVSRAGTIQWDQLSTVFVVRFVGSWIGVFIGFLIIGYFGGIVEEMWSEFLGQ